MIRAETTRRFREIRRAFGVDICATLAVTRKGQPYLIRITRLKDELDNPEDEEEDAPKDFPARRKPSYFG